MILQEQSISTKELFVNRLCDLPYEYEMMYDRSACNRSLSPRLLVLSVRECVCEILLRPTMIEWCHGPVHFRKKAYSWDAYSCILFAWGQIRIKQHHTHTHECLFLKKCKYLSEVHSTNQTYLRIVMNIYDILHVCNGVVQHMHHTKQSNLRDSTPR